MTSFVGKNPAGMKPDLRRGLLDDLAELNELKFKETGDPEIRARIAQYEMAYKMQTSVPELTDFSDEPDHVLDLYGPQVREPGTFAYNCLMSRRLAERGVRFVQCMHAGYAPSRIYGTPTTMMWIHRIGLEHAKQFLLTGRPIDAETAFRIGLVSHVYEAKDLSRAAEEEARRFAGIPSNQLALNKLLINQTFENMGLRTSQIMGTFFDGIARHTPEAQEWASRITDGDFGDAIAERDRPWGDYGQSQ